MARDHYEIVSAIVGNLALLHHGGKQRQYLAVSLKHNARSRYDRPGFRRLSAVLKAMLEAGLIVMRRAVSTVLRTGIKASGWLLAVLKVPDNVRRADIGRAEGEEVLWLMARGQLKGRGKREAAEPIDYEDTPQTYSMRREVEEINTFLSTQAIDLHGEPQAAFKLQRRFTLRSSGDPHLFDLHGRLYGGFWMNLKATERAHLRINGEPIADLDFASMFPRLAYAKLGIPPPQGDLYAIPGLEGYRGGVKAALSAMLSSSSEMRRLPPEARERLPRGWTAARIGAALKAKHPALVLLFGKDYSMDLMFTESNILVATLLELARNGIPALPMHDGLMVPQSRALKAEEAMMEVSRAFVGTSIPVSLKA